ncbi:hypothetical protein JXR93_09440 [bacterium]|nr:hypothetical protein [bacterium]
MRDFIVGIIKASFKLKNIYHILFPIFLIVIIGFFIFYNPFLSLDNSFRQELYNYFFAIGRVFIIAILSSLFALIFGFLISFLPLKITKRVFTNFFIFPIWIYLFLFFGIGVKFSITYVIIIFGFLKSYSFYVIASQEMSRMYEQHFISSLKAVGVKRWRIFIFHMLPNIIFPLFIEIFESVIWIIEGEFILSFSGVSSVYYDGVTTGGIIRDFIINNKISYFVIILSLFFMFLLELRYFFQKIRSNFERFIEKTIQ